MASSRVIRERAALEVYGGKCSDCGASEQLEFDHLHGGGEAHRKVESLHRMQSRIARSGARLTDVDLQLLCHRCHQAKGKRDKRGRYISW